MPSSRWEARKRSSEGLHTYLDSFFQCCSPRKQARQLQGVSTYTQCFKICFWSGRWAADCLVGLVTSPPFQAQLCALAKARTNWEMAEDKASVWLWTVPPGRSRVMTLHCPPFTSPLSSTRVPAIRELMMHLHKNNWKDSWVFPVVPADLLAFSPLQSTTDLRKMMHFGETTATHPSLFCP